MIARNRTLWAVLATLVVLTLVAGAAPGSASGGAGRPCLVYGDASGLDVIEDYGAFSLVNIGPGDVVPEGSEVEPLDDATMIYLDAIEFDTSEGAPVPGADLRGGGRYFLVQFVGPIKASWLSTLESLGAEILDYVPNYAFVTRMDAPTALKVEAWDRVRWVGLYHPAYRIDPRALEGNGAYVVEMFEGSNHQAVKDALRNVGFEIAYLADGGVERPATAIVRGSVGMVKAAARLDGVAWIEPFVEPELCNNVSRTVIKSDVAHSKGVTGLDEIVAVTDTGLYLGHECFSESGKVVAFIDIAGDGGSQGGDGYGHGTHVSGSVLGDAPTYQTYNKYDGQGFSAREVVVKVFDNSGYWAGGSDYYGFWDDAYHEGARVNSNSWGSSSGGAYGTSDSHADRVMWDHHDYLLSIAACNDGSYGPNTVGSPGTAKNVITVGAVETDYPENIAYFSSRGPTDDGRIKPDVTAPGRYIHSAQRGTVSGYTDMQGTSMATPQVSGSAALVRQYFRDGYYPTGTPVSGDAFNPSGALVKAVLINGAEEMTGTRSDWNNEGVYPNNAQGWGRINVDRSLYFSGDSRTLTVWDDPASLSTGQSWSDTVTLSDGARDLRFTLAWTDYYASSGASIALVNDLDLEVTAPDGTVFKGNNFQGINPGYSVDGGSYDDRNTVEGVHLLPGYSYVGELPTGTYTVRVIGSNVARYTQNFAVAVSSGPYEAPPPPEGDIALMGDYGGQLESLLTGWGYDVDTYSGSAYSSVISNLDYYDAVVLHDVDNAAGFDDLLAAAAEKQKGLVFCSSYTVSSHAMGVLSSRTDDPGAVAQDWADGAVSIKVQQSHPIFDGYSVAQDVTIISGGDNDYQTFDDYAGSVLATSNMPYDYPNMVGVKNRSETGGAKHVVMGSFGACYYTDVNDWTADGKQIFHNAIEWARTP